MGPGLRRDDSETLNSALPRTAGRAADGDRLAGAVLQGDEGVARLEEGHGIDRAAVDPDLVVQVAAGRAAGRAHQADQIAAVDALAGQGDPLREVAVAGLDALAVVDLDQIAVAAIVPFGASDDAVCGRVDRGAHRAGEIDPGVHRGWTAGLSERGAEAGSIAASRLASARPETIAERKAWRCSSKAARWAVAARIASTSFCIWLRRRSICATSPRIAWTAWKVAKADHASKTKAAKAAANWIRAPIVKR